MSESHIHLDEYLGQAFQRIPVAMIVVNPHGNMVRVNDLAATTFGYGIQELNGQPIEMLVPERYRGGHARLRDGFMLETGGARPMGAGRHLNGVRKDGSEFPVEIGITPVDTGQGRMVMTVIIDLSERKQAEQRIQDALMQKDLLLREVHHRVKNNLQVIHSLLDLQAIKLRDHELVDVLRDSQNRIRSMSLIHQTLYQSPNVAQVDFQRFLDELLSSVSESYRAVAGKISLQADAHGLTLPIDQAIPCGLVINELVSNALKHGFNHQAHGTIRVELKQEDNARVELTVSNDGAPIPEDHNLDRSGSLGLQLVKLLTRQLGGQLQVQRAHPVCFTLRFDLEKN